MSERQILISMNEYLAKELRNVVHDLSDQEILFAAASIDERCIRDVAIHAHRPVLAATAIVTGRTWPARPSLPQDGTTLRALLREMAQQIHHWLAEADAGVFSTPVDLRWGHFDTGADALLNSLVHGFVHVGAIRGIRAMGGFPAAPES